MRIFFICLFIFPLCFAAETRLKDLVTVKGVRDNPLIGYGLVIGLNGTGDGGGDITTTSLKRMFQKLGLNPQKEVSSKNVAAVIVTTKMQPFSRMGQKIDVVVSSIGDASSLGGGTLLVTPLKGGDGHIYAIAHGPLSIGGLTQGQKFPTTASISSGATIEKEIDLDFHKKKSIRFNLNSPDFTTAARIEKTLNQELGGKFATAKDSSTIDLVIPTHYERNVIQLMAIIENFRVNSDNAAKVVINEKTGTIVAGGDVVIKEVAISHGNLTVEVGGEGDKGKSGSVHLMKKGTSLNDLVKSLNALGAGPDDLIAIFKTLKQNNSILAEVEFQ
jgi:flagellar P-ring protein precursor FlgI